jgi:transposase
VSTSLLYHGFGVQGYVDQRTQYLEGEIHFTIIQPDKELRCSDCGSRHVIRKGAGSVGFGAFPSEAGRYGSS